MRRLIPLLGLVAVLALATPAAAAPTNVTIQPQASWESTAHITVGFTATCTGGTGTLTVRVATQVPQPPAGGVGSTPVVCDGSPHDGAVSVGGGPWQPGPAIAQATLFSPGGGDTDSRTIQIV